MRASIMFMAFCIAILALLRLSEWYKKNKENIRSEKEKKTLSNESQSLKLLSEDIEDFLNTTSAENSQEREQAAEFLEQIRAMIIDTKWVIDRRRASFKTKNRTKDKLLSISATFDIYANDNVFYSLSFTRTNIPVDGGISVVQDITNEYAEAIGIAAQFSKKYMPEIKSVIHNYEIQIDEYHYLFENPYIRKLAGKSPILKKQNKYDELKNRAAMLENDIGELAKSIIDTLDKSRQFAKGKIKYETEVSRFIDKYMPTINEAIEGYSLNMTDDSKSSLIRTLEIMDIATKNFYKKLIETDIDKAEVNQTVLEQQLMREGLYSPYDIIDE